MPTSPYYLDAFSGFAVKDLKQAREFYTQKLGLAIEDNGMGIELELPGGGTVFIYEKADHEPADFTILNLVVENIDQMLGELVSRGVTFEHYEGMPQDDKGILRGLEKNMGPNIAWFTDPSGNILSILQQK